MGHIFRKTMNVELPPTFRRISYDDAIDLYGSDKPELRFGMEMQNGAPLADMGTFQAFKDALAAGGAVKALVVPGMAEKYSRKMIEDLEGTAKIYKAKGLGWMKVGGAEDSPALEGGVSKFFEGKSARITSYNVCYTKLLRLRNPRAPTRAVSRNTRAGNGAPRYSPQGSRRGSKTGTVPS